VDRDVRDVRHHRRGRSRRASREEDAEADEDELRGARLEAKADAQEERGADRVGHGDGELALRRVAREAVGEAAAENHADARNQHEHRRRRARFAKRHGVMPVQQARQPRDERADDEELQAAAGVREHHGARGEEARQQAAEREGPLGGGAPVFGIARLADALFRHGRREHRKHHEAENTHGVERPAPPELRADRAPEGHPQDGAEHTAG
jgi:hypothetical protein